MAFTIPGLSSINWASLVSGGITFIISILLILAGAFFIFWWAKGKRNKRLYNKSIHFFEEINGVSAPTEHYQATEITVPNTNIQVFYIKELDLYQPRLTRRMGKDSYWVFRLNNRELVNFTMPSLNKEMTEMKLLFDHTDMRYAHTNMRELIRRNFREKSQPWYVQYKEVISLIIIVFVISVSMYFVLTKVATLIERLSPLIDHVDSLIKSANTVKPSGLGVVA